MTGSSVSDARWCVWRAKPILALWQVVCLSVGFEPSNRVERRLRLGGRDSPWRDPKWGDWDGSLPDEFWNRLEAAIANVGEGRAIPCRDGHGAFASVLPEVAAQFIISGGWWVPDGFHALIDFAPNRVVPPDNAEWAQNTIRALGLDGFQVSRNVNAGPPPELMKPTSVEPQGVANVPFESKPPPVTTVHRLSRRRDDLAPAIERARGMVPASADYAATWVAFVKLATSPEPMPPLCGTVAGGVKYRTAAGFKSIARDAFIKRLKYADRRD